MTARSPGGLFPGHAPIVGDQGANTGRSPIPLEVGGAPKRSTVGATTGLSAGATHVVPLVVANAKTISVTAKWFDDLIDFGGNLFFETTDLDEDEAPVTAAAADELWHREPIVLSGGPIASAGIPQVQRWNISTLGMFRGRLLFIVATGGEVLFRQFGKTA